MALYSVATYLNIVTVLPGLKTRVSRTTVSEDASCLEQAEAGDDMPVRILNTDSVSKAWRWETAMGI